jgi:hypothetical protein
MRKIFRRRLAATLVICTTALISSTELALANVDGPIAAMFADPSDFVVLIDANPGQCGSQFFHVKRANENFKEVVAVFMTAFALGKRVVVVDDAGCEGNRNIISHAWTYR